MLTFTEQTSVLLQGELQSGTLGINSFCLVKY